MEHFDYKEVLSSTKMNMMVDELNSRIKRVNGQLPGADGNLILQVRNVVQFDTREDFPVSGVEECVYLCKENDGLYRWDDDFGNYKPCGAKSWPIEGPDVYNGVYIKYTDGTVTPYDTMDETKTPVGVAVIYNEETVKLVMHPSQLSCTRNDGVIFASNCVYTDGSVGHLPLMNELNAFLQNKEQVNVAMELIGGTILNGYMWSSSSGGDNYGFVWNGGSWVSGNPAKLGTSYPCRSVCAF